MEDHAMQHDNNIIDCRDEHGWSPLHYAAAKGEPESCWTLLQQGADANIRTGKPVKDGPLRKDWYWDPGDTPLLLAAEKGQVEAVKILMEGGAQVDLANVTGWGVLHAAVVAESGMLVTLLLDAGASPNAACQIRSFDEGLGWYFVQTPLHLAALRNCLSATAALIDGGADVGACSIDRRTPLIYAAARGSTSVVELLCARGADPNQREHQYVHGIFSDMTPLHYAARNGHTDTVESLLRRGAEPRVRESHSGLTPAEMSNERERD
jgi:cytohesin